jgi:hypothetical protein
VQFGRSLSKNAAVLLDRSAADEAVDADGGERTDDEGEQIHVDLSARVERGQEQKTAEPAK